MPLQLLGCDIVIGIGIFIWPDTMGCPMAGFAEDPFMPFTDPIEHRVANSWGIRTGNGRAWFPYFRLYSPKQAFIDKTWVLPDIERVK